jgi:hypothetical protein
MIQKTAFSADHTYEYPAWDHEWSSIFWRDRAASLRFEMGIDTIFDVPTGL